MRLPVQRHDERGQVLVIVALGLVAMVAMVALVIDGGFAWAKQRDTQNAADAAAEAGATVLMQNLAGVSPAKTDADVETAVDQAATDNGTTLSAAFYTNIDGDLINHAGAAVGGEGAAARVGDGTIPPNAAGVRARTEQTFDTFLASVIGFTQFTASAPATAVTGYSGATCSAGAGCGILPVTFPVTTITCDGSNSLVQQSGYWPTGVVTVVPLCSNGPGNVGWIDWDPTAGGASELEDAILAPANPALSWPEWFKLSQTGGPDSVEDELRNWDGATVQIPLFDNTCDEDPAGPGVDACPAGHEGGTGSNQWYHLAALTAFTLCSAADADCLANGTPHGAYIQGSNGSVCLVGNGATDCLVGKFVHTSYQGQVTAAPGPDPTNQSLTVQLIH